MSIYYEAATIFDNFDDSNDSLKTRVYSNKSLKSSPGHLYAVLSESAKWSSILKDVIERSELLQHERKLTPALALLLTHDLLLAKRGIVAPAAHPLRVAISKHKARLGAEFTKLRVKNGFASIQAWQKHVSAAAEVKEREGTLPRPRWIRLNTIPAGSRDEEKAEAFADWTKALSVEQVVRASSAENIVYYDTTVPNLIAVPKDHPLLDILKTDLGSRLIYQDKASCFPALLLDPKSCNGDVIDACAAPGNKTTHLAALLEEPQSKLVDDIVQRRVLAFERDAKRAQTLSKMKEAALPITKRNRIKIYAASDFLSTQPDSPEFANVQSLLLDPSCSGSGMPRDDKVFSFELPAAPSGYTQSTKKRKRDVPAKVEQKDGGGDAQKGKKRRRQDDDEGNMPEEASTRLEPLSRFQLLIVEHAMKFSAARRIAYSTCSTHWAENESVVLRALASKVAKERRWRILKRPDQFPGLRDWAHRGVRVRDEASQFTKDIDPVMSPEEQADIFDACIRCNKGTEDGTHGFFVAGFVRDSEETEQEANQLDMNGPKKHTGLEDVVDESAGSWNGFSDDEMKESAAVPKSQSDRTSTGSKRNQISQRASDSYKGASRKRKKGSRK